MVGHAAERGLEPDDAGSSSPGCGSTRPRQCRSRAAPCRWPPPPPRRRSTRRRCTRASHGFRVAPKSALSVTPFSANSGVVVFPEDHRAGRAEPRDHGTASSFGTRSANRRSATVGGPDARGVERVLHRERHAVEAARGRRRASPRPRPAAPRRARGPRSRRERVQRRVHALDPAEERPPTTSTGESVPGAKPREQVDGGEPGDLFGHVPGSSARHLAQKRRARQGRWLGRGRSPARTAATLVHFPRAFDPGANSRRHERRLDRVRYGFVIDHRKCIGCHACTVACKEENRRPARRLPHLGEVRREGRRSPTRGATSRCCAATTATTRRA